MARSHLQASGVARYDELAGQIERTDTQSRQFLLDPDPVDQAIQLFVPGIEFEEIR